MKIYCSGIGGIGLSAYASLQRAAGHIVMGSDRAVGAQHAAPLIDDLRSQGITITLDQSGASVPSDADLFVYSEAIPPDAPERRRAQELGILQQSYPEALGVLSKGHTVIAVCGTHGKSSTTGMAARLLMHSGRDPTVVVGTKLKALDPPSSASGGLRGASGRNWRKGRDGGIFLLEACEYRNAFHHYNPSVILMTTCDGDHFDFYTSIEDYRASFITFIHRLPTDGTLITHLGDPDCRVIADGADRRVIDADTEPLITLKTPGRHMQGNAQLVLALARLQDIPDKQAQAAVSGYAGSWRRMELKGNVMVRGDARRVAPPAFAKASAGRHHDIVVIDDYGHHPREIRATLDALIAVYPGRRIICAFQPHTHDRTLKLYREFTECFRGIDTVVVTNVYEARKDIETDRVDLPRFIRDIEKVSDVRCVDGGGLADTEKILKGEILRSGDVLVCMGAGDITGLATAMVSA